jgi:hypothetical protein
MNPHLPDTIRSPSHERRREVWPNLSFSGGKTEHKIPHKLCNDNLHLQEAI